MGNSTLKEQFKQRISSSGNPRLIKIKRATKQLFPKAIEDQYIRSLNAMVNKMYKLFLVELIKIKPLLLEYKEIRKDDISDDVAEMFGDIRLGLSLDFTDEQISYIAKSFALSTSEFNRKQVRKLISSMIGIDPFINEPWLAQELNLWTKSNVSLIKSIPEKFFSETEEIVFRGFRQGLRFEEIAKEAREKFGVTKRRSRLIARDQIGKLNGQLTMLRQQSTGINQYIWRNAGDRRVRGNPIGIYPRATPSHWDREGEVFSWNKPPEGGHPGQDVLCRCYAEPKLDDLLRDLI